MADQRKAPFHLKDHLIQVSKTFADGWGQWYADRPQLVKPRTREQMVDILQKCVWTPQEEVPFPLRDNKVAFRHFDYDDTLFLAVLENATPAMPKGWVLMVGVVMTRQVHPSKSRWVNRPPLTFDPPPDSLTGMARSNYWTRCRMEAEEWCRQFGQDHRNFPEVAEVLRKVKEAMQLEEDCSFNLIAGELKELRREIGLLKDRLFVVESNQRGE